LANQIADELLEIDERPARSLIKMSVQDGQRQHAILRVAEEATYARRANFTCLQVEQARDHLQVVFDAMMNLAKQVITLFESGRERTLAAGDRRGHLADALGNG